MTENEGGKLGIWQVCCRICHNQTGVDPSRLTRRGQAVLLALVFGPYSMPYVADFIKSIFTSADADPISQVGGANSSLDTSNGLIINGDGNEVQQIVSAPILNEVHFDERKWRDGINGGLVVHENKAFLPPGIQSATQWYIEPLPQEAFQFETRFISHGKRAMNFVISIPGVYEIVIGDSDYRNIVLKRSDGEDPIPRVSVPEKNLGVPRVPLQHSIESGTEVRARLEQKLLENGNLWVQLELWYWSDGEAKKVSEVLQYEFEPSPWFEDSLLLHLGLIQDVREKDVSAEIIVPMMYDSEILREEK